MSEEFVKFPEDTKSCAVVLERLDEQLVSKYLQKCDSTKMVGFVNNVTDESKCSGDYSTTCKRSRGNNRQKMKKSVIRDKYKQRKRKTKSQGVRNKNTGIQKTGYEIEAERDELSLKNLLGSSPWLTDKSKGADMGVEVFQEAMTLNKVDDTVENFDDYDYDSRDENEDDKVTIIFERSPEKEGEENDRREEVECPSKKFKNNDTRHWENENSAERTHLKLAKHQGLVGGKVGEKPLTNSYVRERYLNEMCSLVKRLYELYRIISQLQRELPKNHELAVHFSKVIRVQKENFLQEIKRNQKTITDCYEKLLFLYGDNSDKVVAEISKNAFLNTEDVCNIIFRCFLLDEIYEIEKINAEFIMRKEKQNDQDSKTSETPRRLLREKLLKLLAVRKIYNNNHLPPQSHYVSSPNGFNYHQILLQRPPNEPVIHRVFSSRKKAMNQIQRSTDNRHRSFFPSQDDYLVQKSVWTQDLVADPRLRQPSQRDVYLRYPGLVSRFSDSQISNGRPQQPSTHPLNIQSHMNPVGLPQRRPYPETLAPGNIRDPMCFQQYNLSNYIQPQSASYQSSQRSFVSPDAQSTLRIAVSQRDERGSVAYPSNVQRLVDVHRQVVTSVEESQCPLDFFNDSVRFSSQKLYQKPPELLGSREEILRRQHFSIEQFRDLSRRVPEEALDPTVPQILTMKNYRLQAEPTLRHRTEGKVSESERELNSLQSSEEKTKDGSELRGEKSRTRVYVCAKNGCKMPGVRICKGCQSVIYCSETCQLKHWAMKHKAECYQLRELRGV